MQNIRLQEIIKYAANNVPYYKKLFAEAWNFGPENNDFVKVYDVVNIIKKYWHKIDFKILKKAINLHEANLLKLDSSKVNIKLNWRSMWSSKKTFEKTVNWYRNFYEKNEINTLKDINSYVTDAIEQNLLWIR